MILSISIKRIWTTAWLFFASKHRLKSRRQPLWNGKWWNQWHPVGDLQPSISHKKITRMFRGWRKANSKRKMFGHRRNWFWRIAVTALNKSLWAHEKMSHRPWRSLNSSNFVCVHYFFCLFLTLKLEQQVSFRFRIVDPSVCWGTPAISVDGFASTSMAIAQGDTCHLEEPEKHISTSSLGDSSCFCLFKIEYN